MKPLTITLPADAAIGLRIFANEQGLELEAAAALALREWLLANGYVEAVHDMDEATETVGSA